MVSPLKAKEGSSVFMIGVEFWKPRTRILLLKLARGELEYSFARARPTHVKYGSVGKLRIKTSWRVAANAGRTVMISSIASSDEKEAYR